MNERWQLRSLAGLGVGVFALVVVLVEWMTEPGTTPLPAGHPPMPAGPVVPAPAGVAAPLSASPATDPGSAAIARAPHPADPAGMAGTIDALQARLQRQPDDADGWAMLARTQAVRGAHDLAVPAFRRAAALRADDPVLLADFADSLAMVHGGRLAGEPLGLVQRALALDAGNLKALSLAGTEAFDRGDFAAALQHWQRLLERAPADHALARQIAGGVEEARRALAASSAR